MVNALLYFPITSDVTASYAGRGVTVLVAILLIAGLAAHLASRSTLPPRRA